MNFRFTWLKSVISFISLILVDLFFSNTAKGYCLEMKTITCLQPKLYQHIFDINSIVSGLIIGLVVYIVWSLIQKKRK